jgi:hypothetical protein
MWRAKREKCILYRVLVGNPKERDCFEDPRVNGSIIPENTLKILNGRIRTNPSG